MYELNIKYTSPTVVYSFPSSQDIATRWLRIQRETGITITCKENVQQANQFRDIEISPKTGKKGTLVA